jgi:hypothetical protein
LVPVLYSILALDLKIIRWEANDSTMHGEMPEAAKAVPRNSLKAMKMTLIPLASAAFDVKDFYIKERKPWDKLNTHCLGLQVLLEKRWRGGSLSAVNLFVSSDALSNACKEIFGDMNRSSNTASRT